MDETTLEQRTQKILHLLAGNDPKYPKTDFLMQLMHITKQCPMKNSTPYEVTDERALRIITDAARWLAGYLDKENRWQELLGGWHEEDIYEVLAWHIAASILPRRVV